MVAVEATKGDMMTTTTFRAELLPNGYVRVDGSGGLVRMYEPGISGPRLRSGSGRPLPGELDRVADLLGMRPRRTMRLDHRTGWCAVHEADHAEVYGCGDACHGRMVCPRTGDVLQTW